MASPFNATWCALVALVFWTALGLPVVRRLLPRASALPFAPIAGWAMHSVVAVPIFFFVPFTAFSIALVGALAFPAIGLLTRADRAIDRRIVAATSSGAVESPRVRIPWLAWIGAALLAIAVAAAILPKHVGDAVIVSDQIYDHAKVSLIDDMARLGLPPGNPYTAHDGGSGRLSYYYLLHFSAAELSRLLGVSGWEADIAMTFFAAFTSLAAMMGLAVRFSGRVSAAGWVVALAASASARQLLIQWFGGDAMNALVLWPGGFGGWLFQSSWVPQHIASTSCVLLAVTLMSGLGPRHRILTVVALGLSMAAAFESSTWIGGVVFAFACVALVPYLIVRVEAARRPGLIVMLAAAGALTLLAAWPFLVDQLAASTARHSGSPIAVAPWQVIGDAVPAGLRRVLDPPAFWLLLLPIELTAAYAAGMTLLLGSLAGRSRDSANSRALRPLALVTLVSLSIAWLLVSQLAENNDLAWRAGLLASTLLIVFGGVGLSTWVAARRWLPAACAVIALAMGLPTTVQQIERNFAGHFQPDGVAFANMPAVWERVRGLTTTNERVVNNPMALKDLTPWPVNLPWSLLADRRSCYATWELNQVYSSVPHDRLRRIDEQFIRVFAGRADAGDVRQLATDYDCSVVVVTPQDGAWRKDPFRDSGYYDLVDENAARWRIYRRHAVVGVTAPR